MKSVKCNFIFCNYATTAVISLKDTQIKGTCIMLAIDFENVTQFDHHGLIVTDQYWVIPD